MMNHGHLIVKRNEIDFFFALSFLSMSCIRFPPFICKKGGGSGGEKKMWDIFLIKAAILWGILWNWKHILLKSVFFHLSKSTQDQVVCACV